MKKSYIIVTVLIFCIVLSLGCTEQQAAKKKPVASFTADPISGLNPLSVDFDSSDSYDSDGTIVGYSWKFSDGDTSTEISPSHVFDSVGFYMVELTVTDNDGMTNTTTQRIDVTETENIPPTASASASSTTIELGTTVFFYGSGTDLDGTISSYDWDFGTGAVSYQQNPSNFYQMVGEYQVTLTVKDNKGSTGTDTLTITVVPEATTIDLLPSADASVIETSPDTNFGSDEFLQIGSQEITYIKYDLAEISLDATVTNAKILLFPRNQGISTPVTILVHQCNDNSWEEQEITWSNKPTYDSSASDTVIAETYGSWYNWDVTTYVQNSLSTGTLTLVFDSSTDALAQFYGIDAWTSYDPILRVDITYL